MPSLNYTIKNTVTAISSLSDQYFILINFSTFSSLMVNKLYPFLVLICISPINSGAEYLFVYLWVKYQCTPFVYSSTGLFVIFL